MHAHLAVGNARRQPDELRVIPGAAMSGFQKSCFARFLVELEEFDPLRRESRPEKQPARIRIRIIRRAHPDAGFEIGVGILDGVVEPALFPGRTVKAEGVGPVVAANIAFEI